MIPLLVRLAIEQFLASSTHNVTIPEIKEHLQKNGYTDVHKDLLLWILFVKQKQLTKVWPYNKVDLTGKVFKNDSGL